MTPLTPREPNMEPIFSKPEVTAVKINELLKKGEPLHTTSEGYDLKVISDDH